MPRTEKKVTAKKSVKRHATQQSVDQAVKSICDIMRRGNCAGAMQYVPELTWILFLRILDEREQREEQESAAVAGDFRPSLASPYRWRDWGAPPADNAKEPEPGWKRAALKKSASGSFFNFVNAELLPHLKKLKNVPDATPRQKVISEIMTGVERVRIDTERNFQDVLDKVHQLKELKKGKSVDVVALKKTETNFSALTKEARELTAKAEEILSAVYDLKAVNPNRKQIVDDRTPEDLIALIEAKGREISEALATLKEKKIE